jgi:hypothetical protein
LCLHWRTTKCMTLEVISANYRNLSKAIKVDVQYVKEMVTGMPEYLSFTNRRSKDET